jgi:ammonia channel protein AmtB
MSAVVVRALLAAVLLALGVMWLQQGRPLAAAVNVIFAMVAGLLAYSARPGVHTPPRGLIRGLVVVGIVLWVASLVWRTR